MIDLSQFANVAGLAVLVGLLIQLVKPSIPSTEKAVIPWLAVAIGLGLALLIGLALGQISSLVGVVSWAIGGVLAGLTAVGIYEGTIDKLKA